MVNLKNNSENKKINLKCVFCFREVELYKNQA